MYSSQLLSCDRILPFIYIMPVIILSFTKGKHTDVELCSVCVNIGGIALTGCCSLSVFSCQDQCDHSFKEGMKLEAVNPLSPENIHVATVTRVKGQYIWLGLEGNMGFSSRVFFFFLFNMKINMQNICVWIGSEFPGSRSPEATLLFISIT